MTAPRYNVSSVTPDRRGNAIYEIVTDTLQRIHVMVPYANTDAETVGAIIDAALQGLYAKPKPTH